MRHDKLETQLKLMLLLTENHNYTSKDICERMGISQRNFYYYLEFFREAGFKVENKKPYYKLSKESPFFRKLSGAVSFTEDEALALRQLLDKADDDDLQVQRLRQKLDRLYDLNVLNNVQVREQIGQNVTQLYEAIKLHRCVVLKNYSSPHSDTQRDRFVEPFLFLPGHREVRCYEKETGMNKTFKIMRMQQVEMLDLTWEHEREHREMYTDVFMFSGEEWLPVRLRLNRLAYQVLMEEYPQAERYVTSEGDGNWLLEMNVCSYVGIGRFVLGLFDSIEILGSDDFKKFIKQRINLLKKKK